MNIKIKNIFLLAITLILLSFIATQKVEAVTFSYPNYDVEITINSDSSFTVKEKVDYILNGKAHGLRRDLPLSDEARTARCLRNPSLTCGGFDRATLIKATDNEGNALEGKGFQF